MSDAARLAEELEREFDQARNPGSLNVACILLESKWREIIDFLRAPAPMPEGGAEPVAIVAVTFAGIDGREEMGVNWTGTELPDEGAPLYSATALQAARREVTEAICVKLREWDDKDLPECYDIDKAIAAIRALPGAK